MEQKEYPVGSRFQVNGQWYEVKPCIGDIVCTDCCFISECTQKCNFEKPKISECKKPEYIPDCVAPFRKDNANVYYVKIDPPTDVLDTSPMTRAIGSTFYDEGVKLLVCDFGDVLEPCSRKCYYHDKFCGGNVAVHGFCAATSRSDRKWSYFKEVKDEKQRNKKVGDRQQAS